MTIYPEAHLAYIGDQYLRGKRVLEIGCGDGYRSAQLAAYCSHLTGVDPDADALDAAKARAKTPDSCPIDFVQASAEDLPFADARFDCAVFLLSLHHVPHESMSSAIYEAVRVTTSEAAIIFVEPGFRGSFFELDSAVGACDGDERLQKARALEVMLSHPALAEVEELHDTTRYSFGSVDDFLDEFELAEDAKPKVTQFLTVHGYALSGDRRINVFRKA